MNTQTTGILLLVLGLIFFFGKHLPFVGHLPGDIYVTGKHCQLFLPLGTCLLASLVLSILLRVLGRH